MANMQTVRKKIEQGFFDCGWEVHNGLGSFHWKGGGSWAKALKPLMEYLDKREGAKNTEQQVQPDNANETVVATFYVRDDGKQ